MSATLRSLVLAVAFLGAVVVAGPADGAWPEGWSSAPIFGADVRSLTFDPLRAQVVYAGTASGQIDVSADGGRTWRPAGVALPFPGWVVGALRFDPNRPERLWAGLWGVFGGGLVAWSDDGGRHWTTPHAAIAGDQIYALALVPGKVGRVLAGTRAGVLISDDDAASWRLASRNAPELVHVSSLWVDPSRPERILAGTWRRAYRSDDGGATWRGVFEGMVLDTEVFSLQSVLGRPEVLWASTCGWVYRTADGGDLWTRRTQGLSEKRTPSFAILGGEAGTERVLAGTVAGAFLSTDGGATFSRTSPGELAVLAIAQDPRRPETILLGTEGSGVWRSEDGGASFAPSTTGMTHLRIGATETFRGHLLVAVHHAGPASGLYVSADGGRSFARDPRDATLPAILDMAPAGDLLLLATERGLFAGEPGAFRRLQSLGEERVEQVDAEADQWVARTATAVFQGSTEREGAAMAKLQTRSVARWQGEILASTSQGLRLLPGAPGRAVAAPESRLDLLSLPSGVVAWGKSAWFREAADAPWRELAGGVRRVLRTGDPTRPLFITADREAISLGPTGAVLERFPLPFAGRDVLAAERTARGWALGTSGYGLVLYEPTAGPVAASSR